MNWPMAFVLVIVLLFRVSIWAVTAYAVFWLDRSGWWFLFALVLTSVSPEISYSQERK